MAFAGALALAKSAFLKTCIFGFGCLPKPRLFPAFRAHPLRRQRLLYDYLHFVGLGQIDIEKALHLTSETTQLHSQVICAGARVAVRPTDTAPPDLGFVRKVVNGSYEVELDKADQDGSRIHAKGVPRVRILPVLEYHICTDGGYFEEIDTSGVGVIIFAPSQWQRLQGELSRARSEAIEHDFLPARIDHPVRILHQQILKDPSDFGQVLLPIITERLIGKHSSHRPEMHGQCISKALLTLAETKMGSGSIPYCFINWITHGDNLDANDKGSMGTAGTRSLHALKQADHDLTI